MKRLTLSLLVAVSFCMGVLSADDGWTTYSSRKYGFSMLIPKGTAMMDKEFGGGWAGAYGEHEGVIFEGITKLGKATHGEIVEFGIRNTGVAESRWSKVDSGDGWTVYAVEKGENVLLASVVVGSKAGFLLFLKTTKSDIHAHKADYEKWYKSVKID